MKSSLKTSKHLEFEQEALPHLNLLHNFARRMTNSREDASDLVQEAYLKAFRFWGSYEKGTNVKAWLFRILKNTYINNYRQELREPETVDLESVQNIGRSGKKPPFTASDMGVANLLEDDVAKALAELQDEFRTVVILSDIEGLTYEEIAEFTESPVGTVRSRLHRGRKLLRAKLLDYAQKKGVKK
jgi:RNA polymerase sigma-70 factor (ECF subfamily)